MKSLVVIGSAIAAIAVLALVVVIAAGDEPAPEYPVGTAEGAFQRYLAAYEAGEIETAYSYLSSRIRDAMTLDEYLRQAEEYGRGFPGDRPVRRVLFEETIGEGDRATLRLTVEEFYGEGLSASRNRYPIEVRMVREGAAWHIDDPLIGLDHAFSPALPDG